ncbi:MAG TPA: hypothetical protein PK711_00795 [Bacteroidales bacterium]|nr:hypothetical protein [Bacteroidales bacterium]HRZ22015.1 hypothetical protein [Bacteroidales bacterium]
MVPAIPLIKQKRYINAFQRAGATDEAHACTPEELGLRDSLIFKRMIVRGIFIQCPDGRYYLNVPLASVYQSGRQYFLRIFLLVLLILFIALLSGMFLK